ncbi:MAG TPA: peptidase M20 [Firmicutes bacterium]|nr:peptidase M20 [Bacillota bacterium]
MEYTVSEKIAKAYELLKGLGAVQSGIEFIKDDEQNTLEDQLDLVVIEAPTFQEANRAKAFAEKLAVLGLEDVQVDRHGNAFGVRRGKGNTGKAIVIEGHLDTVFPMGTVTDRPEPQDGVYHCPGIADDTRGLVAVLSVLRAFEQSKIETHYDIIFMGTAREEGMGGFGGIKGFLADHDNIVGCINIDGASLDSITYQATGMKTFAVNFYGIGGHAYGSFAKVANPLHAAARAVAKIADIQVPASPKTTYAVSNFHAGNDAGVHAIVPQATIKMNMRSDAQDELDIMYGKALECIKQACDEETARWGMDTITYDIVTYVDVKAGTQSMDAPIVQAIYTLIKDTGIEPSFGNGGNTNATPPIAKGVPAVCIGGGGNAGMVHTTKEWWDSTDAYKGPQLIFYFANLLAGIEGVSESIL